MHSNRLGTGGGGGGGATPYYNVEIQINTPGQVVSSSSVTNIDWTGQNILRNNGTLWSASSPTLFVAPTKGIYVANLQLSWIQGGGGTSGQRGAWLISSNDSFPARAYTWLAGLTAGDASNASAIMYLNAGDYTYAQVYQNSGGTMTLGNSGLNPTAFTMALIQVAP